MESGMESERHWQNMESWRLDFQMPPHIDYPRRRPQSKTPRAVDERLVHKPLGIDLICNGCQHHVSGSQELSLLWRTYSLFAPRGTPRVKCFTNCLNCFDEWEVRPEVGDADKFFAFAGATQHFPAAENVPESNPNLGGELTSVTC